MKRGRDPLQTIARTWAAPVSLQSRIARVPFAYFVILALFIQASALHQFRLWRDDRLDELDAQILAGFAVQAKQSPVGVKPAWNLGNFFKPLSLPGKAGLQVDLLRRWSKQNQELPPRETIALSVSAALARALATIAAERGISIHDAARLCLELGIREPTASRQLTLGQAPIGGGPRGR
jgi:hypothetical protein